MLYLEDYLEMIEHLPQELRDRFTEMRELDLTVQNSIDSLEKKTRAFFMQCKRNELPHEAADVEFQNLRKEYYKVLEDADEKVAIATQIHELVERYLRRLDSELFKFKCELEADNNGITEILEKRSLEADSGGVGVGGSSAATALMNMMIGSTNQKENRYYGSISAGSGVAVVGVGSATISGSNNNNHNLIGVPSGLVSGGNNLNVSGNISIPSTPTSHTSNAAPKDNRYGRTNKTEKRRNSTTAAMHTAGGSIPEKRISLSGSANNNLNLTAPMTVATPPVTVIRPMTTGSDRSGGLSTHHAVLNSAAVAAGNVVASNSGVSNVAYNLQQLGSSATNAIAAAASQAIVATQQMQQGRRTASLKASFEAIHGAAAGGVGPPEFWINRDTGNATTAAAVGHVPMPATEKKKKRLSVGLAHTMTAAAAAAVAAANQTNASPAISLGSSSSLSVDSVDMLPTAVTTPTTSAAAAAAMAGVTTLGLNATNITGGSGGASTSAAAAAAAVAANRVSSVAASTPTSLSASSTALAPGSNITVNENGMIVEQTADGEWSYDPNEPRYCTCNQVSYGDMVACDNDACPYEWFHYPCVGITQPPKGKWFCPKCTVSMRRRGSRKQTQ